MGLVGSLDTDFNWEIFEIILSESNLDALCISSISPFLLALAKTPNVLKNSEENNEYSSKAESFDNFSIQGVL